MSVEKDSIVIDVDEVDFSIIEKVEELEGGAIFVTDEDVVFYDGLVDNTKGYSEEGRQPLRLKIKEMPGVADKLVVHLSSVSYCEDNFNVKEVEGGKLEISKENVSLYDDSGVQVLRIKRNPHY